MLIPGVSRKISQIIKVISDLASWASALVLFAANMVATLYITLLVVILGASLFPHLNQAFVNGGILSVISLSALFLGALLLVSFVMCKSMVKLWPWRDTLLTVLWAAWQAYGFQYSHWPSWVIGVAILFALSATLRWRVYFLNRRSIVSANIS